MGRVKIRCNYWVIIACNFTGMDMLDYQQLIKLEKLFREKAVLRQLIQLYGLYEERILVRGDATNAQPAAHQFMELSQQGRCGDLALIAEKLALKEDEMLFGAIASHCFPLFSKGIDIWLENFTDIADVLIITSDNMLKKLSAGGNYEAIKEQHSHGLKGSYKKNGYYVPVHSIGGRHEEEILIVKTDKFGILRQHIPLPFKIEEHIAKTIFHVDNADDDFRQNANISIHETLEYLPSKGFFGYFVKVPIEGTLYYGRP